MCEGPLREPVLSETPHLASTGGPLHPHLNASRVSIQQQVFCLLSPAPGALCTPHTGADASTDAAAFGQQARQQKRLGRVGGEGSRSGA